MVQGRVGVASKPLLSISRFGALEVVSGPPLGTCTVRDPRHEALARRLRWLVVLANLPGLVGNLHRMLASSPGPEWVEPTPALGAALADLGWKLERNTASSRGAAWPLIASEPRYSGQIFLDPQDDTAPSGSMALWVSLVEQPLTRYPLSAFFNACTASSELRPL